MTKQGKKKERMVLVFFSLNLVATFQNSEKGNFIKRSIFQVEFF